MRYRNCITGRYFWLFVYKQFINEYRSVNFEAMLRMFSIKGHKPSFWHDLNSQVISISSLPIGWLLTLGCQIPIFPKEIIYSDDFSKYLSVNGVITINTHRTVCGSSLQHHSIWFNKICVLEKTNANYNVCFICALLNMPIEYFSMGEGGCMYWSFLSGIFACIYGSILL